MSAPPPPLDLDITVISAKHLKNVNWRNGDLLPYAIFWLDPHRRISTKSDDSGSTSPVWNERFLLPLPPSLSPHLSLEIYHSNPSDTPKPLVGSLRIPLPDPTDPVRLGSFDLRRPSGRPHGKIKLKLVLIERPVENYQFAPTLPYYYPPIPRPPPPQQHPHPYGSSYSEPYSGYYPRGYYPPPRQGSYGGAPSAPYNQNRSGAIGNVRPGSGVDGATGGPNSQAEYPPYDHNRSRRIGSVGPGIGVDGAMGLPSAPVEFFYNRSRGVGNVGLGAGVDGDKGGPSAPVEYPYDQNGSRAMGNVGHGAGVAGPSAPVEYTRYDRSGRRGIGNVGLGVGLAGAMGGLTLEEGVRRGEDSDLGSHDGYSEHRSNHGYN